MPIIVNNDLKFYLDRAALAQAEADAATLENVRQRSLRSAMAWSEMAARIERGERMRRENETARNSQVS